MTSLMDKWREASSETKLFLFSAALFLFVTLGGVFYAYARLDFVRSYDNSAPKTELHS